MPRQARMTTRRAEGGQTRGRRQVNIRVGPALYQTLQTVARQERRSISQTVQHLLEQGLQLRFAGRVTDDPAGRQLAILAIAGETFEWLAQEPERYDDTHGEPL